MGFRVSSFRVYDSFMEHMSTDMRDATKMQLKLPLVDAVEPFPLHKKPHLLILILPLWYRGRGFWILGNAASASQTRLKELKIK